MQAQSSNGKSKVEASKNVGDSRGRFVVGNGKGVEEKDLKLKIPLLSPPPPVVLSPSETRKATMNLDKAVEYELTHGRKLDPKMDRKKLRRTVSNRLSAQRSRVKKAQYIHELERRASELEDMIAVLTIRVKRYLEKKKLLELQNEALERLVEVRRHEAHLAQLRLDKNQAELAKLKEEEKELLKKLREQEESSCTNNGFQQDQPDAVAAAPSSSSLVHDHDKEAAAAAADGQVSEDR